MKITLAAVTAIAGLVASSSASAATVKFKATLNGAQEVPAVTTTSAGTADLNFDDVANTLTGTVEVTMKDGAEVQAAHIHVAECGKSGSIYKDLVVNTPFNGIIAIDPPINLDADRIKALNEGRLYVNVHTKEFTGGEVRGQIFKEDSTDVCPAGGGATDGGGPTTTPTDGGGNTSSSGGTTDGGTSGAAASDDDGGCSTSGGSGGSNGMLLALGVLGAVAAVSRRSGRDKRAKQR